MDYKNKLITTKQALDMIKDGYKVATSEGQGAPRGFLSQFHTIDKKVKNVEIWSCRLPRSFPYLEQMRATYSAVDTFVTKAMRSALLKDASYAPTHLSRAGITACASRQPDIYVFACTPPDEKGNMSAGLGGVYTKHMRENSRIVIAEINKNMPYTFGDTEFNINDVDYITEETYPLDPIRQGTIKENELKIGKLISEYINDGDCLQVGIGGIPDALMECLEDKKDLGIHTELLGTGLVKLAKKGMVNGSKKTLHKGVIVTSTIDGDQEVFDFVNKNPAVLVKDSSYTNDANILAANDNQVSVNTTIEVDITGQCCSESFGSRQYSGTGGQADTAVGAQKAKGGRSFIVLCSTTNIVENGDIKMVSKIVPQLKRGATVSLQRNDVQYIATEYGIVNLRGLSIRQRVAKMISIAHPGFREWLTQEAVRLELI